MKYADKSQIPPISPEACRDFLLEVTAHVFESMDDQRERRAYARAARDYAIGVVRGEIQPEHSGTSIADLLTLPKFEEYHARTSN